MEFLLAFVLTMLLATGGWIVWGARNALHARTRRRHALEMARERELTERKRLELRERELADEIYRDFTTRQNGGIPPVSSPVRDDD
ncbi:MAG TPA: hypothetical protein VNP92_00665 [Actinophytocola sp.]|nr:hypothetical protein [Actinophytocola sp.]